MIDMSSRRFAIAASLALAATVGTAGCGAPKPASTTPTPAGSTAAAAPSTAPAAAPGVAVAILVEGTMLWMGNDSYEQDADQRRAGNFAAAGQAVEALAAAGPDGTRAEVLTYGDDVTVRRPFDDARSLKAAVLGGQHDYDQAITNKFQAALEKARADLAAQAAPRKVLVVIGDGRDVAEAVDLAPTAAALKAAGIQTYTILVAPKADLASMVAPDNMKKLGDAGTFTAADGDIAAAARQVVAAINQH